MAQIIEGGFENYLPEFKQIVKWKAKTEIGLRISCKLELIAKNYGPYEEEEMYRRLLINAFDIRRWKELKFSRGVIFYGSKHGWPNGMHDNFFGFLDYKITVTPKKLRLVSSEKGGHTLEQTKQLLSIVREYVARKEENTIK